MEPLGQFKAQSFVIRNLGRGIDKWNEIVFFDIYRINDTCLVNHYHAIRGWVACGYHTQLVGEFLSK
jgi:hypothetical protein